MTTNENFAATKQDVLGALNGRELELVRDHILPLMEAQARDFAAALEVGPEDEEDGGDEDEELEAMIEYAAELIPSVLVMLFRFGKDLGWVEDGKATDKMPADVRTRYEEMMGGVREFEAMIKEAFEEAAPNGQVTNMIGSGS